MKQNELRPLTIEDEAHIIANYLEDSEYAKKIEDVFKRWEDEITEDEILKEVLSLIEFPEPGEPGEPGDEPIEPPKPRATSGKLIRSLTKFVKHDKQLMRQYRVRILKCFTLDQLKSEWEVSSKFARGSDLKYRFQPTEEEAIKYRNRLITYHLQSNFSKDTSKIKLKEFTQQFLDDKFNKANA